MRWEECVQTAVLNLKANKMRSILSMLGIVIGTGSVIVVTSMVNGVRKESIESRMAGMTDVIQLQPRYSKESRRFGKIKIEDLDRIQRLPHILSVLPDINDYQDVKGSRGKEKANLSGIDSENFENGKFLLIDGRKISKEDVERRRRVGLINKSFAKEIFGIEYPIHQRVRVKDSSIEIIGIFDEDETLKRWGRSSDILVPVTTLFRMLDDKNIQRVQIRAEPGKLDEVKKVLEELINSNPSQASLFQVRDPRDDLEEINKWARNWLIQMTIIAGISLFVGGIGLMNVMLITVAERTREIGLRKALGANSKAIRVQFLIESITLSGLGGITGVLVGYLISRGIEILSGGTSNIAIIPLFLLGSFLFSVVIGIVFGLYPASKAARLSPVEALRYE